MTSTTLRAFAIEQGGTPTGEGILWIHGYTMNGEIWKEHWHRLPGFRHLSVDLPGHGRAARLAATETLGAWSEAFAELVRRENVRHIVALSFGGLVGLALAARLGSSLETLTVNSPAVPGGAVDSASQGCNLELIRLARAQGRGQWLTDKWLTWPHHIFTGMRSHPERWAKLQQTIGLHEWLEFEDGSVNRMSMTEGCAGLTQKIVADTLIIVGEHDLGAFKRNAQMLVRGIPRARKVYLPDCGHLALLENPEVTSELVSRHIHMHRT